jgi:RNA polymerase sigma-70 factor (ECF subfamily)
MGSTVQGTMSARSPRQAAALVPSARAGDHAAREALARRAGEAAFVFALQLTRSPDAARDIAQDAVLRFFAHLDRYDPEQPIEPWLFAIVRNLVRDAWRRARVRDYESLDRWLEQGGAEPAGPDDPAAIAERRELQGRVWQAISELGHAHREILVLRDYHGLSYREIADVLAIPDGTVMSRLHAARERLRQILIARQDGITADDQIPGSAT